MLHLCSRVCYYFQMLDKTSFDRVCQCDETLPPLSLYICIFFIIRILLTNFPSFFCFTSKDTQGCAKEKREKEKDKQRSWSVYDGIINEALIKH